jgi:hypothetical protein
MVERLLHVILKSLMLSCSQRCHMVCTVLHLPFEQDCLQQTCCPAACHAVRCLGVPLTSVANANWATDCGTTVGSTCTASCVSSGTQTTATCTRVEGTTTANWVITSTGSCAAGFPTNAKCSDTNGDAPGQPVIVCSGDSVPKSASSDIPIAGLEAAAAEAACCDKVYPATATCANSWTTCPSGSTPNPDGQINGLVVGSADAQKICCSSGVSISRVQYCLG